MNMYMLDIVNTLFVLSDPRTTYLIFVQQNQPQLFVLIKANHL